LLGNIVAANCILSCICFWWNANRACWNCISSNICWICTNDWRL